LHLCPTFQTTTGFLSSENWRRWEGSLPEWRPYRKGSEASIVPQYNFEIPIIGQKIVQPSACGCRKKVLTSSFGAFRKVLFLYRQKGGEISSGRAKQSSDVFRFWNGAVAPASYQDLFPYLFPFKIPD
jgi:hypothetical protein